MVIFFMLVISEFRNQHRAIFLSPPLFSPTGILRLCSAYYKDQVRDFLLLDTYEYTDVFCLAFHSGQNILFTNLFGFLFISKDLIDMINSHFRRNVLWGASFLLVCDIHHHIFSHIFYSHFLMKWRCVNLQEYKAE